MKKCIFIVDSAGNTRDYHRLCPIDVDFPNKGIRDSITSFMLMNSVRVMIFDYPDCMMTFRYRQYDNCFPFAVVVDPYAAKFPGKGIRDSNTSFLLMNSVKL